MTHKCDGCRYKSEHQEMGFASMGVCTRTTDLVEASQNYRAEKCPYKKTNFERIKAMSVEKMAEWLDSFSFTNCDCCAYNGAPCSGVTCEEGHTTWLETEVAE